MDVIRFFHGIIMGSTTCVFDVVSELWDLSFLNVVAELVQKRLLLPGVIFVDDRIEWHTFDLQTIFEAYVFRPPPFYKGGGGGGGGGAL